MKHHKMVGSLAGRRVLAISYFLWFVAFVMLVTSIALLVLGGWFHGPLLVGGGAVVGAAVLGGVARLLR